MDKILEKKNHCLSLCQTETRLDLSKAPSAKMPL